MILHTIVNQDEVMGLTNQFDYCYKNINGIVVEGIKSNDGVVINRLISTNPSDYLNPKYNIGEVLK